MFYGARKRLREEGKPFWTWFIEHALVFPKVLFWGFSAAFYIFPLIVFRCLPWRVKWPTRYARSYAAKSAHEVKIKMTSTHLTKHNKMHTSFDKSMIQTPLASFLSIYDICILVIEELHYNDIVALSQTSKSVHEALFPSMDLPPSQVPSLRDQRLAHYRLYSCDPMTKSTCYLCMSQICGSCQKTRTLKQTHWEWHLDNCVPFCQKCYVTAHKTTFLAAAVSTPRCVCGPPHREDRYLDPFTWWSSNQRYKWQWQYVDRTLCGECNKLENSQIEEGRVARSKAELRAFKRPGMNRCGGGIMERNASTGVACGELLKGGPTWWICGACKKECTRLCHAPWTSAMLVANRR